MKETRHTPMKCKECGYQFDTSTSAYGAHTAPKEGDLSVCLNCGAAMVMENGLWRCMSIDEVIDLDPSDRAKLFKAQRAQHYLKEHGMGDLTIKQRKH